MSEDCYTSGDHDCPACQACGGGGSCTASQSCGTEDTLGANTCLLATNDLCDGLGACDADVTNCPSNPECWDTTYSCGAGAVSQDCYTSGDHGCAVCNSCDGSGACTGYTANNDVDGDNQNSDDCNYCNSGSWSARAQCDGTECAGDARCETAGGDCAYPDASTTVCATCYSGTWYTGAYYEAGGGDCCGDDASENYRSSSSGRVCVNACCDNSADFVDSNGNCCGTPDSADGDGANWVINEACTFGSACTVQIDTHVKLQGSSSVTVQGTWDFTSTGQRIFMYSGADLYVESGATVQG